MEFAFQTEIYLIATAIALFAGVAKGVVGFGMPTIFIVGLGLFVPPQIALAGLIFPTLVSNGYQALRQGHQAAIHSVRRFWLFLAVGGICLLASSQLVTSLSERALFLTIGLAVTAFALAQLANLPLMPARGPSRLLEVLFGAVAGVLGGVSGIWGPPTVAYLTALGTEKRDQIRVQGVIYGLGAVALAFGHLISGILTNSTIAFSLYLIIPAMLGMRIGTWLQDRIDQRSFRIATLVGLILAGLNLVRKGLLA